MAFRDILKQNRQQGAGILSSMATAASASTRESMDIRNTLFKSGSLMNAIFPNVKGYQYKEKTSRLKTSPELNLSSDKLDAIAQSTSIAAKNSIVLPSMARDMFLMKQNIIKMVRLQGGTPTTKSGDWFSRQLARENAYESQFKKTPASKSPTPVKESSSGMGLFTTLALASAALMAFGGEIGKTIGAIGLVISALMGLKTVIGAILAAKGLATATAALPGRKGSAGPKIKMPGLLGMAGAAAGLAYLNSSVQTPNVSDGSESAGDLSSMSTTQKVVAGGIGAYGAYAGYKGVTSLKPLTEQTKMAVLDARTQSVSQLANSQPNTKWGKFLAFVARKSPKLWGKIGVKLAQAGALMAIPVVGWIGAAINLGFSLWTAWELYELWKEFTNTEDKETSSPTRVNQPQPDSSAPASSGGSSASPTPASQDGMALLNKVMDREGIKDPEVRNRIMNLAQAESSLNANARGPVLQSGMHKGDQAHGILQVMPKTAQEMGFSRDDIQDPEKAAAAGVRYFMKNYKDLGTLDAATVAHHAGPGKAREFLKTGSVSTRDLGTGLGTMDYLARVKGSSPQVPGSSIAASSTAVADGRMVSSSQPVVINSPQTVNNVSSGGGSGLASASSVFDTEFGKLLIERSIG
jgi:hypothetical protein